MWHIFETFNQSWPHNEIFDWRLHNASKLRLLICTVYDCWIVKCIKVGRASAGRSKYCIERYQNVIFAIPAQNSHCLIHPPIFNCLPDVWSMYPFSNYSLSVLASFDTSPISFFYVLAIYIILAIYNIIHADWFHHIHCCIEKRITRREDDGG